MSTTATRIEPVSLTICRRIKATPAQLYGAFTDPLMLARWMGPGSMKVVEAVSEARVGGRYMLDMRDTDDPDGEPHVVHGVFKELVPNLRVVQTWRWQSAAVETLLTLTFAEVEPGVTELTLRHERFTEAAVRDKHQFGWNACLTKLLALYPEA